jgi:hypothetical protein
MRLHRSAIPSITVMKQVGGQLEATSYRKSGNLVLVYRENAVKQSGTWAVPYEMM